MHQPMIKPKLSCANFTTTWGIRQIGIWFASQECWSSDQAVRLASEFRCDVCHNRQRPAPCLPASAHQLVDFNHRVGLDVKRVVGWQENQTVPCLNVVDYASGYQLMFPFYEVETGELLRDLFMRGWQQWLVHRSKSSLTQLTPFVRCICGSAGTFRYTGDQHSR